jgi:hypothetical protein
MCGQRLDGDWERYRTKIKTDNMVQQSRQHLKHDRRIDRPQAAAAIVQKQYITRR